MKTAHLITHVVKFLRKLSKIKGDKKFESRRGGRYQIKSFDNDSPHFNDRITSLFLRIEFYI